MLYTIILNFTNLHFLSFRTYNVTKQLVLRSLRNYCCSLRVPVL